MDIYLKSRADITAWSGIFTILGSELCVPIWSILGFPQNMFANPKYILKIAEFFFSRGGEIVNEKQFSSDKEVENYFEACRMVDLGHLYKCFGKIVAYYGEETAKHVFRFGQLHFVGDISRSSDDWHFLFSRILGNKTSIKMFLSDEDSNHLIGIIRSRFEEEESRSNALKVKFEKMCEKYSSNLEEERGRLNKLVISEIDSTQFRKDQEFENICDELEWIFGFDLLLSQICVFEIWHGINRKFTIAIKKDLFDFGLQQLVPSNRCSAETDSFQILKAEYFSL